MSYAESYIYNLLAPLLESNLLEICYGTTIAPAPAPASPKDEQEVLSPQV